MKCLNISRQTNRNSRAPVYHAAGSTASWGKPKQGRKTRRAPDAARSNRQEMPRPVKYRLPASRSQQRYSTHPSHTTCHDPISLPGLPPSARSGLPRDKDSRCESIAPPCKHPEAAKEAGRPDWYVIQKIQGPPASDKIRQPPTIKMWWSLGARPAHSLLPQRSQERVEPRGDIGWCWRNKQRRRSDRSTARSAWLSGDKWRYLLQTRQAGDSMSRHNKRPPEQ